METTVRMLCVLMAVMVVFTGTTESRRHWDRRFCRDEKSYNDCNFWNTLGLCKVEAYFEHLAKACPKTCNLCTWGLEEIKVVTCKDKDIITNCQFFKQNGACQTHSSIMAETCASTCNLCDAGQKCTKAKCNFNQICELDANQNAVCSCPRYCINREGYENLGRVCGSDGKTYDNYCQMKHQACVENNNITVTKYGYCEGDEPCDDTEPEKSSGGCETWKSLQLCEHPSVDKKMRKHCSRTCGYCDQHLNKPARASFRGKCDDKEKSPYGCCWDLSFKPNPNSGKKCPVCRDHYKFCPKFLGQCNNAMNFNFMKEKCSVTCGFCTPEKKPVLELKVIGSIFRTQIKHTAN